MSRQHLSSLMMDLAKGQGVGAGGWGQGQEEKHSTEGCSVCFTFSLWRSCDGGVERGAIIDPNRETGICFAGGCNSKSLNKLPGCIVRGCVE